MGAFIEERGGNESSDEAAKRMLAEAPGVRQTIRLGRYEADGLKPVYEAVSEILREKTFGDGGGVLDGAPELSSGNMNHTTLPWHVDHPGVIWSMPAGETGGGGMVSCSWDEVLFVNCVCEVEHAHDEACDHAGCVGRSGGGPGCLACGVWPYHGRPRGYSSGTHRGVCVVHSLAWRLLGYAPGGLRSPRDGAWRGSRDVFGRAMHGRLPKAQPDLEFPVVSSPRSPIPISCV